MATFMQRNLVNTTLTEWSNFASSVMGQTGIMCRLIWYDRIGRTHHLLKTFNQNLIMRKQSHKFRTWDMRQHNGPGLLKTSMSWKTKNDQRVGVCSRVKETRKDIINTVCDLLLNFGLEKLYKGYHHGINIIFVGYNNVFSVVGYVEEWPYF